MGFAALNPLVPVENSVLVYLQESDNHSLPHMPHCERRAGIVSSCQPSEYSL